MALNGLLIGWNHGKCGCDYRRWSFGNRAYRGALVVGSIIFFDKIKIDDPVGAISVHGVCGIWGTVATAIFADGFDFMVQLKALSVSVFAFVFSYRIHDFESDSWS